MKHLNPYLSFAGTCEEALNFYKEALNGEIVAIMRYSDAPMDMPNAEEFADKVLHSEFKAGDIHFMASDSMGEYTPTIGNNINLSLHFDNTEEQAAVFNSLSAGGTVVMPLTDAFWGAKFGVAVDKFGISWMFNCPITTQQ